MPILQPATTLTKKLGCFTLSLVLFQFATYIAHDMIQPGMLIVTDTFGVGPEWVSASLSAYLLGGIMLQWLLGPLSDKYGRRPVLMSGVLFFILTCTLIYWAQSMLQFVALRFLQGTSLCFIGAVGYAAVQESFDEALGVKMMALMANIALLAPIAGPLAGAAWLSVGEWRTMFLLFAVIAWLALLGLWRTMPETAGNRSLSLGLPALGNIYLALAKERQVMSGSAAIGLLFTPILSWVALSPLILMAQEELSRLTYALLQAPVFTAMIIGNLLLSRLAGWVPIEKTLGLAAWPLLFGLGLAAISSLISPHSYLWLTAGISLYALGAGMANAGLYRLTLFSSDHGKGCVAAMLGMVSILVFALGIEASKWAYLNAGSAGFSLMNALFGLLWFGCLRYFLREYSRASVLNKC